MECQPHSLPTDYRLNVVGGPDGGKMYPLAAETRVGRDPHADVFIGNGLVARWQCVLVWEEETCRHFLDRGWFRPVFINGRQVGEKQSVALQAGDRITIADSTFVYEHNKDIRPAGLQALQLPVGCHTISAQRQNQPRVASTTQRFLPPYRHPIGHSGDSLKFLRQAV